MMNYFILIKLDLEGDFYEDKYYDILFEYDNCSNIISLENEINKSEDILKNYDKKTINMMYKGISRLDKKKIFILNTYNINRDLKFKELGI